LEFRRVLFRSGPAVGQQQVAQLVAVPALLARRVAQRMQYPLQLAALAQPLHEGLALALALLQHVLHQVPALHLVHPRPGADLRAAAQATFAQAVAAEAAKPDARAGYGKIGTSAHVVSGDCWAGNDCAGMKPAQQHVRRWTPGIT